MESRQEADEIYFSSCYKKRKRNSCNFDVDRKVVYVHDAALNRECDKIPHMNGRADVVSSLIESYNLFSYMTIKPSILATDEELCGFHSASYIDYLKCVNQNIDVEDDCDLEYGLGTAVVLSRDEAEGFCYVNDVVLGIQELLLTFGRVLYIDIDIHHGNGVENAFAFTRKVLTLSFHKQEPGFYPGTGTLEQVGNGFGRYYAVNVPLKEGISDQTYCQLFDRICQAVYGAYEPDAVVVQCGADAITGDKIGDFNLTPVAFGQCITTILSWQKPTLFLGGGGYNIPNTARCWAYLTSIIVGTKIDSEIPSNKHFTLFGPDFDLEVSPNNRRDYNLASNLDIIVSTISKNMENL